MRDNTYSPSSFLSLSHLVVLLHKSGRFKEVFLKAFETALLTETFLLTRTDGRVFKYPIGLVHEKKDGYPSFYIHKRAIPSFLTNHMQTLFELGVAKPYIHAVIQRFSTQETAPLVDTLEVKTLSSNTLAKEYYSLWQIASKFTSNSVIVSQITDYIRENLLFETYKPLTPLQEDEATQQMFLFVKKSTRNTLFLKAEALPYFLKKHQKTLQNLARQLEENNDIISLRGFSRYLGFSLLENDLKNFILEHIDEKYEITLPTGETRLLPIFEYISNRNHTKRLIIHKTAIPIFIKRHRETLEKMGVPGLDILSKDFVQKSGYQKGLLSLRTITARFGKGKWFLDALYNQVDADFKNQKYNDLFLTRLKNGKMLYFIKEEDLPLFVERYTNWLQMQGVCAKSLALISSGKELPRKEAGTLTFQDLTILLKRNNQQIKPLLNIIKEQHLSDTYETTDDKGNTVSLPVFTLIYSKTSSSFQPRFANKEALYAFIQNQKELFIAHGIRPEYIQHLLSHNKTLPYAPDYVFITEFVKMCGRAGKSGLSKFIKENYLNDTVTSTDEYGRVMTRPLFVYMQKPSQKYASYAIYKKDIPLFIKRHYQELGISPIMAYKFLKETPIQTPDDNFITASALAFLLKIPANSKALRNKITTSFMAEKYTVETPNGPVAKPFFIVGKRKNNTGYAYYFDITLLNTLLINKRADLIELGVSSKTLTDLLRQSYQDKDFYLKPLKRFYQTAEKTALRKKRAQERQRS